MNNKLRCQPVRFLTPKKIQLDGLWFESGRSDRALIYVHGLGSTMFWPRLIYKLADSKTSVLAFNNRGHDSLSRARRLTRSGKIKKFSAGMIHEVFTDCVDDLEGAVNFCRSRGLKKIILVGHSTGCQKSVYYLSKIKNQKIISQAILLCPISDYAEMATFHAKSLKKAVSLARRLVKGGRKHELLPPEIWPIPYDAQRFLSLFTPGSVEEIFCYATPSRRPGALLRVSVPLEIIFAEKDEYLDRPLKDIITWFKRNLAGKNFIIRTVKNANHGFYGRENEVIKFIRQAIKD